MQKDPSEASRRIDEARRLKVNTLDLGDLQLAEIPAELADLPHLRKLYLGQDMPTVDGGQLTDPDRAPSAFTDLSPLSGLAGLQSLNLSDTHVVDLSPLSGLAGLQSLNLSDTRVVDLSPLSGLAGLQSLNLSFTRVVDLSPLSGLAGLQSFDLSNTRVVDLSPLSGLAELQSLDLRGTGVTDLSLLSGFARLQSLDLSGNSMVDLSQLSGLVGLESLRLSGTIADLSPLSGLAGLQALDLGYSRVVDLSPLLGLAGLQNLCLTRTRVTDLSPLSGLAGLQTLDLSHTGVTDLSPLSGLAGLQSLRLSYTRVEHLSPLSGLVGLQTLDLGNTGVKDLSPLSSLAALQHLFLGSTGVADLSPLSGQAGLQSLILSGTRVTDLSPLSSLAELQSLFLGSTGVVDLSPLLVLPDLQTLELNRTPVTDLAPLSRLHRLQALNLFALRSTVPGTMLRILADLPRLDRLVADRATGLPREILSRDLNDDCLPRLCAYFAETDLGARTENEVKVILLGNGGVGKTQLCRRLRGEPYDPSIDSTHGVQIWRQRLRLELGDQQQDVQLNWWDFGGQDIYHSTHALFLRSRAVFFILWTPVLENRAEHTERGTPLRNQPLAYWLDYVRSLADEDSPVIVVQSQCDTFADRRPDPPHPATVGVFERCAFSARTGLGRDALEAHLRDALRRLFASQGSVAIGRGRAAVRRRLYEWRAKDQARAAARRRHRTLTLDEFRALCDRAGGIVSWEHALDYFHQTGVVFHRPDLFADRIVLDQDWALEAIYTVFHRGRTAPLLRDSGRFTRKDLALLAWQDRSPAEQLLFLGIMESCGVCFRCGQTARGEPRYVAPDLLPAFALVKDRLHAWQDQPGLPTLTLEYSFFHPAAIRGLMSKVANTAGDRAEYWRYGLWLKDARTGSQVLVQFEDTSTDQAPGAGTLVLQAQGRDPQALLREMRSSILQQRIGSEPYELLTLNGTTVASGALAGVISGQVLDVHGQPVAAAPFLAFFAGRSDTAVEGRGRHASAPAALVLRPADDASSAITPVRLIPADKPPEVFLSYAWGDDETPEGKLRDDAVDGLHAALAADGFQPQRDRDQIRPGDRISAFIRRLTHTDLVVAVVSDKYLRSPFCMYEIYRIWQRCQEEPDQMKQRVVPLVLPGVRLSTLKHRAPYVRYWRRRAAEDRRTAASMIDSLSPESLQQVRLVAEFAHHVDGILCFLADILMPCDLGKAPRRRFEPLLEAVRTRLGSR